MSLPQFEDNDDRMVALLEQIVKNTGGGLAQDVTQNVTFEGQTADSRVGVIPAGTYLSVETSNLEEVDDSGSITLEPGDSATLVRYTEPCMLYAIGATDQADVQYELRIDNRAIGGRTNSPIGRINAPFSYVDALGGVLGVEQRVEYVAHYDKDATGTVDLAARLHLETAQP